jgi:hypothetical protein
MLYFIICFSISCCFGCLFVCKTGRPGFIWLVTIFCHNIDLVHVNGHDRIILVIFNQALYKAPWWCILCDPKHVGALLNIL